MIMRRWWERPTQNDWTEVLGALPLFSRLGRRQLRRIARLASVVDYSPGEVMVEAGDRGDSLYLMLEGSGPRAGQVAGSAVGDFFGEMALVDGRPRSATITATSAVRVMRLPRRAFLRALKQDPQIGLAIMETLAERVRRLERAVSA